MRHAGRGWTRLSSINSQGGRDAAKEDAIGAPTGLPLVVVEAVTVGSRVGNHNMVADLEALD